ncbi:MAG: hypothetical protein AAF228_02720 [Pseudomonadota bacterium]
MHILGKYSFKTAFALGVCVLAGCADLSRVPLSQISGITTASVGAIDDPVVSGTPIILYSHVARLIKKCWFDPQGALLTEHMFFAKATPGQNGGSASITLNEKSKERKRGLTAYKIDFLPLDGNKTNIQVHNFRLSPDLGQKLTSDVRHWSHGQVECKLQSDNNKITSIPPGTTIKPLPVNSKN